MMWMVKEGMNMNEEYYKIVKEILESNEFQKRKKYLHHGKITVYEHSLKVSIVSYEIAKLLRWKSKRSVAIGALLHDFYDKPWQESQEKLPLLKQHGFVHAKEALRNAEYYFSPYMDKRTKNIIERHMFPLNITPPRYKEAWLVTFIDKMVSLEVLFQPKFFVVLVLLFFRKRGKR